MLASRGCFVTLPSAPLAWCTCLRQHPRACCGEGRGSEHLGTDAEYYAVLLVLRERFCVSGYVRECPLPYNLKSQLWWLLMWVWLKFYRICSCKRLNYFIYAFSFFLEFSFESWLTWRLLYRGYFSTIFTTTTSFDTFIVKFIPQSNSNIQTLGLLLQEYIRSIFKSLQPHTAARPK